MNFIFNSQNTIIVRATSDFGTDDIVHCEFSSPERIELVKSIWNLSIFFFFSSWAASLFFTLYIPFTLVSF